MIYDLRWCRGGGGGGGGGSEAIQSLRGGGGKWDAKLGLKVGSFKQN